MWCISNEEIQQIKQTAFTVSYVGTETYARIKNLAYPNSALSLKYV